MKYKLIKPFLNSIELSKLNFYANYLGYTLHFNIDRGTALLETEDKNVGYIQRDEFNHIFAVWKFDESIEYLDDKIDICIKMNKHNIFTETLDRVKLILGINSLSEHKVTDDMLSYINSPKYSDICQKKN